MDRVEVSSRLLRSVGYEPEGQVLEIEFHSGEIYQYGQVPVDVHADLLAAESLGQFFNAHIRDVYPFEKLT